MFCLSIKMLIRWECGLEHEYKIVLSKRRLEVVREKLTVAKRLLEYGGYITDEIEKNVNTIQPIG